MTRRNLPLAIALIVAVTPLLHCGSSSSASPSSTSSSSSATTSSTGSTASTSTTLPAIYAKFVNGTGVSLSGTTVIITSKDLPDHKSPYWGVGNALYEAPQPGMMVNPNMIVAQNLTYRIPVSPVRATPSATPLGPIGVATDGVPFYNQYAAGFQPLTSEVVSFDRYNGHPNGSNQYHYHFEPLWLTASSKSAFLGVLLDGFPVYGPQDSNGTTPTDLDSCNGHTAPTPDFPGGIYHYHTTSGAPYISGCFTGAPGTVTGG